MSTGSMGTMTGPAASRIRRTLVTKEAQAVRLTIGRMQCAAIGVLCALATAGSPAQAAVTRSCGTVANPYPDTRYEDVDLTRIRATGLSCPSARRVARGAHRKALGLTPPVSGVRRFTWNGWRVTGDLRGASDSYVAARRGRIVRWRF